MRGMETVLAFDTVMPPPLVLLTLNPAALTRAAQVLQARQWVQRELQAVFRPLLRAHEEVGSACTAAIGLAGLPVASNQSLWSCNFSLAVLLPGARQAPNSCLSQKFNSYNCRKDFPPILKRPLTITGRPRRRGGRKSRTGPTSSTMQ